MIVVCIGITLPRCVSPFQIYTWFSHAEIQLNKCWGSPKKYDQIIFDLRTWPVAFLVRAAVFGLGKITSSKVRLRLYERDSLLGNLLGQIPIVVSHISVLPLIVLGGVEKNSLGRILFPLKYRILTSQLCLPFPKYLLTSTSQSRYITLPSVTFLLKIVIFWHRFVLPRPQSSAYFQSHSLIAYHEVRSGLTFHIDRRRHCSKYSQHAFLCSPIPTSLGNCLW